MALFLNHRYLNFYSLMTVRYRKKCKHAKEKGKVRISADIKDMIVKAKDLTAEAKAKAKAKVRAKATAFVLKDPRGQGLVLEDTSLFTA